MRGEISFEMRCKFVANLIELDINLHLYCIKYEEWLTIYDAEYGPRKQICKSYLVKFNIEKEINFQLVVFI